MDEHLLIKRLRLRKKNDRVYYTLEHPTIFSHTDLLMLKELAAKKNLSTVRICLHKDNNASIQEMLIIHTKPQIIAPHKQDKTTVSYHVLEGEAEIKLYNENGDMEFCQILSSKKMGLQHIRLEANRYRSIESKSDYFIFLEVSSGPFKDQDTIWL